MTPETDLETPAARPAAATRAIVYLGGAALLAAMATDFLAVIGRHVGRPLLGSIEVIQAAVLIASSAAMILATLAERHAVVHLMIDRLSPGARDIIHRIGRIGAALFCLGMVVGGVIIAREMWFGHEESELLRIPYAPLRIVSIVAMSTICVIFAWQAVRRSRR